MSFAMKFQTMRALPSSTQATRNSRSTSVMASRKRSICASGREQSYFIDVCTNTTCLEKQNSGQTLQVLLGMAKPNVTVAECGCLGNCGKGPNVEFLIPGEEALVYNGVSSVEDAAEFLEEHCEGVPASKAAEAYNMKLEGDACASKGDYKAADKAYTRALELDMTGLVLATRANVRLKLGDAAAAVEDAEAACEAKPDWVPAQLVAADAYEELKDPENALRCCSNAYNIDNELAQDGEFMNRVRWLQDDLQ